MVTLLVTTLAIFAIIGIGLYFWQKSTRAPSEQILPPPPDAHGLFADDESTMVFEKEQRAIAAGELADALIARASKGERAALEEARRTGDADLYDRVLGQVVTSANSESKLLALMSHVAQHELPVNAALVKAAVASWKKSPNASSTSKVLHFAALSDDAGIFCETVEIAMELWRDGKLKDISAVELRALFDGEFWILSSRSRSSGAGFVLKRTLASARRELEVTAGANQ